MGRSMNAMEEEEEEEEEEERKHVWHLYSGTDTTAPRVHTHLVN